MKSTTISEKQTQEGFWIYKNGVKDVNLMNVIISGLKFSLLENLRAFFMTLVALYAADTFNLDVSFGEFYVAIFCINMFIYMIPDRKRYYL